MEAEFKFYLYFVKISRLFLYSSRSRVKKFPVLTLLEKCDLFYTRRSY
jgi:hypothetical protein